MAAGRDRGGDRHLHRLHLRLYHHPHQRPLQGLSEDHRHPAHPVPALHPVPVHHLPVRAAGAHHQRAAEHHGQRRLRHGQPDRGAGAQLLPHRLYDPLRHPLLHRRVGGGRGLQHGGQPVAHLLDRHLPPVPAGHHLRLPAGVHPVAGGLLQSRHHRRRLHHPVRGGVSDHHRQLRHAEGLRPGAADAGAHHGGISAEQILGQQEELRHRHRQAHPGPQAHR